jgi:peptidoglycan/xylan/chitin deacetylase (PgdA/CDA1 family)
MKRRALLRRAGLFTVGAGVGAASFAQMADVADRKLPIRGGAAAATEAEGRVHHGRGRAMVTWQVETDRKLVALTFDDGPRPQWTTMVLDTLDELEAPATFFMVGRRVRKYAGVIRGRLERHEVANHTWNHLDMARRGPEDAYSDVARAHDAIGEITGRAPTLLRPPYGHLGGSTALAATRLGYELVLWTTQMAEGEFPGNPAGHAREIVRRVTPGTILLAHDIGDPSRLVALRGLPDMITSLRDRGYQFVTVSQLMADAGVPS